ncbi:hypothetical protein TW95_gp0757 [Pandoravirus inopinatum]|uniref:Ankyrin repeat protein n=1 Tax=Pandoravirus inopinatum TaxID=1605721 RepID=A0A0B5J9E2_9VIRU|nr:hypothetical protein TW95_gp0757 [Pandoravirus inopinatum]AJF97491.1 hypothetical protein [Pandoravirus inopinatum]
MSTSAEHDSQKETSNSNVERVGLAHMPPEVLLLIGEAISRPRDLLSAQIASRLFAGTSLRGLAAWWGAEHLGRLLEVGAPPGVVRAAIAYERQTLSLDLIEPAVLYCDVRVVRLVCNALRVRLACPHFWGPVIAFCSFSFFLLAHKPPFLSYHGRVLDLLWLSFCFGNDKNKTFFSVFLACCPSHVQKAIDDGSVDRRSVGDWGNDDDCDDHHYVEWGRHIMLSSARQYMSRAIAIAVEHGRIDALKYLTAPHTRLGNRQYRDIDPGLVVCAAGRGHTGIVAYLHDQLVARDDGPCRCAKALGNAAWNAPTVDVALWLRDRGCSGYVAPDGRLIGDAIASGRAATVTHMLLARSSTSSGMRPCQEMPQLETATAAAASRGDTEMLAVAVHHLCHDATPILVGAAREGRTTLLSWVTASDGACVPALGAPTLPMMRAAAVAATIHNQPTSLRWIASHFPDAIGPSLAWTAAADGAVDALRVLCDLLLPRVSLEQLVAEAMVSGSVEAVRFLVDGAGAALVPATIATIGLAHDAMADYVCGRLSHDQLQIIVDIVSARRAADGHHRDTVRRIHERVKGLCSAVAIAMHTEFAGGRWGSGVAPCRCAKCKRPTKPIMPSTTMPINDSGLVLSPRRAKSQRIGLSEPLQIARAW